MAGDDFLEFMDAVDLANVARKNGWRVKNVGYSFTDDDGREHWAFDMDRPNDHTGWRVTIHNRAELEREMALTCAHEHILLSPTTEDNSYTGWARCADCDQVIGGPQVSYANDPGYGIRIAQMLVELRSALHRKDLQDLEGK